MTTEDKPPVDIRGALYLPSRDFNFYQMWANYSPEIIERDLGYAARLDLNAIRTWVNYEFWLENPQAHEKAINHFLTAASDKNIKVLFSLFENVGTKPTHENLIDTNPHTAPPVRSPSLTVVKNPNQWTKPRRFVQWFMNRYRNDERLLAIEIMNEPGWRKDVKRFAKDMFRTLSRNRASIPLTVGATSLINSVDYLDWGSDILQFHYNYPSSKRIFKDLLQNHRELSSKLEKPIWLTEWQKVASFGWRGSNQKVKEWYPNYSSLAPLIRKYSVGNFFWSLMLKPAYTLPMRRKGVLNGLFYEDGAVWSLQDARELKAMSGNRTFYGVERKEWPDWASSIKHPRS
ncbi:glycoside hydrolase [Haladaptatus sp. CMAA 1911]|uniref:glycoside hydrolase n=1 Tax=unclassified Haladaptatus TaxID=2622732 RepID=UPI0037553FAD